MSEPSDFVTTHADEYDPVQADRAEAAARGLVAEIDDELKRFIDARRRNYTALFSHPEAEFVMLDLARFCRAYYPTWNENQKVQDLYEGRREVFLRIMSQTLLDTDTLFTKHMKEIHKGT